MVKNKINLGQSGRQKEQKEFDLKMIDQLFNSIEDDLANLRELLFNDSYQRLIKNKSGQNEKNDGKIIEGVFNGEEMLDNNGKHYLVPPNYASKSKLVAGDILKLTISSDGSFIYKQIGPIERQKVVGHIIEKNNKFQVDIGGKKYNVLNASITYFKAKNGDKVTIVVPKAQESNWAAIENIVGQ